MAKVRFSFLALLIAMLGTGSSLLLTSFCYASVENGLIVKSFDVVGLKHVPVRTVLTHIKIKEGELFDNVKAQKVVKRLYSTQFFNNVSVSFQKGILRIKLQERPIISSVDFSSSLRQFDKKVILEALKKMDLGLGHFFSQARLHNAELDIKKLYLSKGFYGVKVEASVSPVNLDRVAIFFKIFEGKPSKIRRINFLGNNMVSTSILRGEMHMSTPNWFSWYSKSHFYSKEKFDSDINSIRAYYLNHGFYNFRFISSQTSISPDRRNTYLNFSINEGHPYYVSDVYLSGDTLSKDQEFRKLIKIKKGDLFSQEKLEKSKQLIKEKLGKYGYAFPVINVDTKENHSQHQVLVHFNIRKGTRLYVRNINIHGNSITRDDVIRREMRQFESAWYDNQKLSLSRDRLNRLGYFNNISLEPSYVAGVDDQLDINIKVDEAKTGSGNLSLGYSSTDRLVMGLAFSKDNISGTGNNISTSFNNARASRSFEFSQYNPYYTVDNISRSTNLFYRTTQPLLYSSHDRDYRVLNFGGDLQFGVPISEIDRIFFGAGFSRYLINLSDKAPHLYSSYVANVGSKLNVVPLTIAWSRDVRDNLIAPAKGYFTSVNLELGTPIGLRYYKLDLRQKSYYSFGRGFTLGVNGVFGYGRSYAQQNYPIFKNYYAGGIGTVRGYSTHSLGPRDVTGNDAVGGSKLLLGNVELMLPLPGTGYDRSLRIFTFFDAGNVWGPNESIHLENLRFSYGIGLAWISPVGPLSISYGLPLKKHQGDKYDRCQFNIGASF